MFQKLKKEKSNKRMFFLLISAIIILPVFAEQIGEKNAHKVATQILSQSPSMRSSTDTTQLKEKSLQMIYKSSSNGSGSAKSSMRSTNANEKVYFYVFCAEDNEGFVIVSGDDRVVPVLGYSHTNGFSTDDMPPNLEWWLGEYAKQIQFAIENDIETTEQTKQQWEQYLGNDDNKEEE